MKARSAGALVRFYNPTRRPSLACRLGWHRPIDVVASGEVAGQRQRRLTCPCQTYYWLEQGSERERYRNTGWRFIRHGD